MAIKNIKRNAIRCKHCGQVIESISTHDFKWCACKKVFVDGGFEYMRRSGEPKDYEELSVYEEDK